jgi:hypothetical protein
MSPSLLCAIVVKHELVCPSRLSIKCHPHAGSGHCRQVPLPAAGVYLVERIGHLLRVLPELGVNVVLDSQVADGFHSHHRRESASYYGSRAQ